MERYSVAERDGASGVGCDTVAGDQDANQVQGISGGECDDLADQRQVAHSTNRLDRHWLGKLLTEKAIHEAAAANLTSVFQPSIPHQQFAPARQVGLPR